MRTLAGIITFAALSALVAALPAPVPAPVPEPVPSPALAGRASKPTVSLGPSATVIGTSLLGVESFKGIPFADPPTGSLRLKPPQKLSTALGTFDATGNAAACPQMFFSTGGNDFLTSVLGDLLNTPLFQTVTDQSEDCLSITVARPAGTTAGAKLPVLFWIFGGGFEVERNYKAYSHILSKRLLTAYIAWVVRDV